MQCTENETGYRKSTYFSLCLSTLLLSTLLPGESQGAQSWVTEWTTSMLNAKYAALWMLEKFWDSSKFTLITYAITLC